jgi:CheY-like chemotaxis protein
MGAEDPRDRLESLGRTSAELLHDLAADLQVLRGWARLVADGVRSGRATPPDADALEDESERVGRLVADLVDWLAHPHPRTSFSPAARLRAVVDRVDRREGVVPLELRTGLPEDLHISGPATFFDRIAANLIRNAVRHAERRVRVTLDPEHHPGAEGVRLRVEDDGSGIDPALRGRLFSPFARGAATGHGLGLSSTAWLVEQLAGLPPEAHTSPMGGACMDVWFPTRPAPTDPDYAPYPLTGLRVVLVDDEEPVRRVLIALLERERMQVEGMDYAPDLLDRLVAIQPDLLLLDRHLGHVSGLDLWRALRRRDAGLARRTVLLSGAPGSRDQADHPAELRKPLDLSAFRRVASQVLRGSTNVRD